MILWRIINEGRCSYLGDTIKQRCRKKARWRGPVLTDPPTPKAYWVVADFCNSHAELFLGVTERDRLRAQVVPDRRPR